MTAEMARNRGPKFAVSQSTSAPTGAPTSISGIAVVLPGGGERGEQGRSRNDAESLPSVSVTASGTLLRPTSEQMSLSGVSASTALYSLVASCPSVVRWRPTAAASRSARATPTIPPSSFST